MSIFGWSYPPGAANDPNAPYNQKDDECGDCELNNCMKCPILYPKEILAAKNQSCYSIPLR